MGSQVSDVVPHGRLRPFHQKSTCLEKFSLGPSVIFDHLTLQILSVTSALEHANHLA